MSETVGNLYRNCRLGGIGIGIGEDKSGGRRGRETDKCEDKSGSFSIVFFFFLLGEPYKRPDQWMYLALN
jgi:hypothetical protein